MSRENYCAAVRLGMATLKSQSWTSSAGHINKPQNKQLHPSFHLMKHLSYCYGTQDKN